MEFCPVCILRKALAGGVESGESSSWDTLELTPDQPPKRFEHFELVTGKDGKALEMGRGAMGVTYKAFDINLHCPVTLKVISERYLGDESARLRFRREARAAASVRHPNVASVFHLGRTGDSYFYAMEFVEGETLEKLIKRSGRLEVKLALEIATQVAAGLAAAHEQHLVHRDIKPTNIMVRLKEEGGVTVKIIDLGLAKRVDESTSEAGISSPGAFAGTPEFASPEQFAWIQVDIRSDLYSLGVTLWIMVTGQTPFRGLSAEVMYQHQHAPLPLERLKDVAQPVVVLLEKLLEKDPAQRFQTPDELLKAMPTITGAIEARRGITRRNLQQIPPRTSRVGTRKPPARLGPKKISVARLPITGSDVFGREEDIGFLDDAWANQQVNVVTIVAWGGVGNERNPSEAERLASDVIELSTRHHFAHWLALGSILSGWARSASGDTVEGVSWIEDGIRDYRATGAIIGLPYLLGMKAEALHLADRTSEALEAIKEAEALVERFEERFWCAELHRLRAVFLAAMGAEETQIEASFQTAISTARQQKSVSETRRSYPRRISSSKSERVRRSWIPAASLLTYCSPRFLWSVSMALDRRRVY